MQRNLSSSMLLIAPSFQKPFSIIKQAYNILYHSHSKSLTPKKHILTMYILYGGTRLSYMNH